MQLCELNEGFWVLINWVILTLHLEGPNCVCNAFYGLIDELEIKTMNVSQIGNG